MRNICFVCNLDRAELQKAGVKFDKHIGVEHNHWNYCYFIIKLMHKDEDNYDGNETYIFENYQNQDWTWLPIGKTKAMGRNDESSVGENLNKNLDLF